MASATREASTHLPAPWPGGFFLTDPDRVPDPVSVVRTLPPGTGVIYRHFGRNDCFDTAMKLRHICFFKHFPLLIANDPGLALRVRADGVHWPEAHAALSRKWKHRFAFQTQSVHSASGMRRAICDAVLLSTVFPSESPTARAPMGAIRFRLLAGTTGRLVYALGGVNGENAGRIAGLAGLAAIDAYL